MEDLVRPRPADPGDRPLVAQQRVQPPAVAPRGSRAALDAEPERLRAEVRELGLRRLGRHEPDAGALLRPGLGQHELAAVLEAEPERGRLRPLRARREVAQPPGAHQVDAQHELAVVGREEEPLAAPPAPAKRRALERARAAGRTSSASRCEPAPPAAPAKRDTSGSSWRTHASISGSSGIGERYSAAGSVGGAAHVRGRRTSPPERPPPRAAAPRPARHLAQRPHRREEHRQERSDTPIAPTQIASRRPIADASAPPSERAERHHAPDDEAHHRVHPALQPLGRDRLAEADLR